MIERCHEREGNNALSGTDCDGVEDLKHRMEKDTSRPRATVFSSTGAVFLQINGQSLNCGWKLMCV